MPLTATTLPRRVRANLTTTYGRSGMLWLDSVAPVAWDSDGDDVSTQAMLEVVVDGLMVDRFAITGDAWRVLQEEGDMTEMLRDVRDGAPLELCLRAQLDHFENHYEHEGCGETWVDKHSCGCDDECPTCGVSISPHDSVQLAGLDEESPAGYMSLAIAPTDAEVSVGMPRPQSRAA